MARRKDSKLSRREIIKAGSLALGLSQFDLTSVNASTAATQATPGAGGETMIGVKFKATPKVRIGFIGVGGRGSGLLRDLLAIDNVEIVAICDLVRDHALRAQDRSVKAGQKSPTLYTAGERDFEKLCARDDIDLVYVATPWDWHVPMAVSAMTNGKHVAVEVPAAKTMDECWTLVNTSEKTRRHCVMLENCCYGYNELLVLNMVRAGLFGELLHGEAAYNHDLRKLLFEKRSEGLWRRFEHVNRNGNLYPTHGLGPVANYMDVNRGDRFDYLVSISSPSVGLYEYRDKHVAADDPRAKEKYPCGDVNTSLIKTAKGRTIMLQHTVSTPHPYDRINLISGSKGVFRDYPARVYIEGAAEGGGEEYKPIDGYKAQYEHQLWKQVGELARKTGGHGGMDFIMNYRLIQCLREGVAPDMDVYDAAAWSAPGPLSEQSVAAGSAPAKFPDFTRGRWKTGRDNQFAS